LDCRNFPKEAGTPRNSASISQMKAVLAGKWTGELEYRDYSTHERVKLPTWLEITEAGDGRGQKSRTSPSMR
jgi:hypothetical protein